MAGKIIVRDLAKRYGSVEAVRGVDFELAEGEILGLLGPNGAGKTSTLECTIGLRQLDTGSISICGIDAITDPGAVRHRIGAALQSTALQDQITPREALKMFAAFYKKSADVEKLIERFLMIFKHFIEFLTLSWLRKLNQIILNNINNISFLKLDDPRRK